MNAIQSIPGVGPAIPYLMALIAVCAALAPMLPPPKSKGAYATVYGVVNFVALNLGHATNKTAPPTMPIIGSANAPLPLVLGLAVGLGLLLSGCSAAQVQTIDTAAGTPAGQLFCMMYKAGTPIVAPIVQQQAGASAQGALAVVVTGMTAAWVQAQCDAAAKAQGADGAVPVAPPTGGAAAPVVIPAGVS